MGKEHKLADTYLVPTWSQCHASSHIGSDNEASRFGLLILIIIRLTWMGLLRLTI
jgi:hypothetical protein